MNGAMKRLYAAVPDTTHFICTFADPNLMHPMISLSSNYPVLAAQQAEFKNIIERHYSTYDEWLTMKPASGSERDRRIAAEWLSGKGPRISEDRIAVVSSGHQAIFIAMMAASLQGSAIAVDEFTYSNVLSIAGIMNVQIVGCKTDEKGMLPSALEAASKQFPIKAVYVMGTISNPTSIVMPLERRLEIIEVARKNGQIIIDDDAYGFLEENPPANFAQLAPDLGWFIYSLSKPVAPDIKVAYIVAPEQYMQKITVAIKLTTSNPSTFFTSLISQLISNGELASLLRKKREEGNRRQAKTREVLAGYEVRGHENGFHCWLKLPEGVSASTLYTALLQEGVEVMPGTFFAAPGTNPEQHIRIAMGAEEDMNKVMQGLEIIKRRLSK
jgi:DNA-binding transcriptional MocR family regulator